MSSPVFVLGTGRCGSTLISELLSAHPTATSLSEVWSFVTDLGLGIADAFPEAPIDGDAFWRLLSEPQPRHSILLRHGLQMKEVAYDWKAGRFTPDTGLPPLLVATLPHLAGPQADALFDALAPIVRGWPLAPAPVHYRALFDELTRRDGGSFWVERSGGSLRIARRLLKAFPDARVVHLVRDGRNTALSMSKHIGFRQALTVSQQVEFLGLDPYVHDDRSEEEDLPADLANVLPESFSKRAFEAVGIEPTLCAHYWSGEIREGLAALDELPSGRLLTLTYEELLAAPARVIRALGEFLDPDGLTEAWVAESVARVGQGRSDFAALPAPLRLELDAACAPGFEALKARGVRYQSGGRL